MTRYSTADREIFKGLYEAASPLPIYHFHEKYLLSPAQVARFVRIFGGEGLVEIDNHHISLTEHGRKWLLVHRHDVFFSIGEKYWKRPWDEWLTNHDEVGIFPSPKRMNFAYFRKLSG